MTEIANEWYKRNRVKKTLYAVDMYHAGNEKLRNIKRVPCYDCGLEFPTYVMQFDHIRGKKSFNISKAQTRKWETVLEEIKKCDIVCGNCHAIRTHNRWCKINPCPH